MLIYWILEKLLEKILKSSLFMLILCFVGNNWNYVRVMVVNVNLLDFTDMTDVMSHGGDVGGNPLQRGSSRVPTQCESYKY